MSYSSERIYPGDKLHTVTSILEVTAGSTPEIAVKVNDFYSSIITADTKWNFLPFRPGLVGGHCIGWGNSYYFKAQEMGYNPEVVRSMP